MITVAQALLLSANDFHFINTADTSPYCDYHPEEQASTVPFVSVGDKQFQEGANTGHLKWQTQNSILSPIVNLNFALTASDKAFFIFCNSDFFDIFYYFSNGELYTDC